MLLHFAFQNLNTDTDCIGNEETAFGLEAVHRAKYSHTQIKYFSARLLVCTMFF